MENRYNIISAQYILDELTNENIAIKIDTDIGGMIVPITSDETQPQNTDYLEVMRQVESSDLTIADAE
jgi:hypothetical protein